MTFDFEGVNSVLGAKYTVVIAGFAGSALALMLSPFQGRWGWIPSVISGFLCACYFTPFVLANLDKLTGESLVIPPKFELGVAFVIGLCGHNIARRFVLGSAEWKFPGNGHDDNGH